MKRTIKITESQMKKIIDRISEGEYPMDEAEQVTSTQYDLKKADDVEKFNDDIDKVTDTSKINVGPNMAQITSETEELSDEDIFLEEEEIDVEKGIAGLPMA
jgi:hypothetical protein